MKKAAASVLLLGVTALMAWFHRGVGAFVPVEVATAPRFGTTTTTTKKYRCGVPPCPQRPTRTATTTIISSRLLVVSKPTTTSLYQHPQHAQHQQRSLQALLEHHHVTFAGSIWPIVQKLHLNPQKASAIVSNVHRITDWKGLALLTLLAFGLTPLSKFVYRYCHQPQNAANVDGEGTRDVGHDAEDVFDETTYGTRHRRRGPSHRPRKKARTMVTGDDTTTTTTITDAVDEMYRTKKRFGVVAFVDQMAKVALSVYAVDVLSITLTTLGFAFCKQWRISEVYAKFACTCWFRRLGRPLDTKMARMSNNAHKN